MFTKESHLWMMHNETILLCSVPLSPRNSHFKPPIHLAYSAQRLSSPPGYSLIGFNGSWVNSCFPCENTLACLPAVMYWPLSNVNSWRAKTFQCLSVSIHLLLCVDLNCALRSLTFDLLISVDNSVVDEDMWKEMIFHSLLFFFYQGKLSEMELIRETEDKIEFEKKG